MIDINDILLVEHQGKLYKASFANLEPLFLPINDNEMVDELNENIDELSSYIYELSSNVIKNYTSIPELNSKYEERLSTDAIPTDGSILSEEEITATINKSNLVYIDTIDTKYDDNESICETEFDKVDTMVETGWTF